MAKEKTKISKYKRTSVHTPLNEFCILSRDHDYMEVTAWDNGEGFDVDIGGAHSERFQLTYGQYDALKKLVKVMIK